jgi:hypothetical protein
MGITVSARSGAIAAAINSFSPGYHGDYFAAERLSSAYLSAPPSASTAMPLAITLSQVLNRWGAGKRGAPTCQPIPLISTALQNPQLHSQLKALKICRSFFGILGGSRQLSKGAPFRHVPQFDACLIDTLCSLSLHFLQGNTNVTYPMKLLLLLTGLMPAFDSQVRGGLAVAGFPGFKKTRYLLPAIGSADAEKICALPFYIAECVSKQGAVIAREIAASSYPSLVNEHGRLFDVLLFMQSGRAHVTVRFGFSGGTKWYQI